MKKLVSLALLSSLLFSAVAVKAQEDKSKRPSPPAKATETIKSVANITIDYSSPSLKGRTIGKDVEPKNGKVWRAGANEATVFETSKNISVEGKALPKGKYAFFVLADEKEWTLIFSKKWDQDGAFDYKEAEDALRVKVKPGTATSSVEKLTYSISKAGKVSLLWGTLDLSFSIK
jgi:hypothetical protein